MYNIVGLPSLKIGIEYIQGGPNISIPIFDLIYLSKILIEIDIICIKIKFRMFPAKNI